MFHFLSNLKLKLDPANMLTASLTASRCLAQGHFDIVVPQRRWLFHQLSAGSGFTERVCGVSVTGPEFLRVRVGVGHRLDASSSGVLGQILLLIMSFTLRFISLRISCFIFSSCSWKREQGPERPLSDSDHTGNFRVFLFMLKQSNGQRKSSLLFCRITPCRRSLGRRQMISLTLVKLWKNPPTVGNLTFVNS